MYFAPRKPVFTMFSCAGSRNILVTLGLSGRSRCGAVLILKCLVQPSRSSCHFVFILKRLAQPSRHFRPVRSLSLRRGAHFNGQGGLAQYLATESSYRDLVRRALIEALYNRGLVHS